MTESPAFEDLPDEELSEVEDLDSDASAKDTDQAASPVEDSTSDSPDEHTSEPAPRERATPRKPWFDTYTAMLAFALLATLAASLILVLELRRYDWEIEPPAMPTPSQPL